MTESYNMAVYRVADMKSKVKISTLKIADQILIFWDADFKHAGQIVTAHRGF